MNRFHTPNRIALIATLWVCCTIQRVDALAQQPEALIAQVRYHFTHVRDTNKRQEPFKADMLLQLGKTMSVYSCIDEEEKIQAVRKNIAEQVRLSSDQNRMSLLMPSGRIDLERYFQVYQSHKLYVEQKLINYYLVEQPLPQINWKITGESKVLDSLKCQKATTSFKGRNYEAWFCADIPFHCGPWQFNGLPGLIIQLADEKEEVVFEFAGLEDVSNQKLKIEVPIDEPKVSPEELTRLDDVARENVAAFPRLASVRKQETDILNNVEHQRIHSLKIDESQSIGTKYINNPIDLTENN